MKDLKMTPGEKKEVIRDCIDNLNYLEVRRLIISLLNSNTRNSKLAYEYLVDNHEEILKDSLMENEIIVE